MEKLNRMKTGLLKILLFTFLVGFLLLPTTQLHGNSLLLNSVIKKDFATAKRILDDELDNRKIAINKKSEQRILEYDKFIPSYSQKKIRKLVDTIFSKYDIKNLNLWTPLNWAIFNNDEKMVTLLLENDADPNTVDSIDATPLHWAGLWADINIIQKLIFYGGIVSYRDDEGFTPLYRVLQRDKKKRNIEIEKLLVSHGAKVKRTDRKGRNAFHIAASQDNYNAIVFFKALSPRLLISSDNEGNRPIHWVAGGMGNKDNLVLLELFISLGVDINIKNDSGFTPLHMATLSRSVGGVKLLLLRSAKINARNKNGETPLHLAAKWGYADVIKIFYNFFEKTTSGKIKIQKGNVVDTSLTDNKGLTALQLALYQNNTEAALEIVRFGSVNPLTFDPHGETAIHLAIINRNVVLLDRLLKKSQSFDKAAIRVKNSQGIRPLDLAVRVGDIDVFLYLLRKGALPFNEVKAINRLFGHVTKTHMRKLLLQLKEDPKSVYNMKR